MKERLTQYKLHIPIPAKEETSHVTVVCDPSDYSASVLARAVEDVDAHLLELTTEFDSEERLVVDLRVSHSDPSSVVRSLERYGYEVTAVSGQSYDASVIPLDRLLGLNALLNV